MSNLPYVFGSGTLVATPFGANAAANPTPLQLGTMQECSIEFSASQKELYGKLQFPVAIARTAGKLNMKAKFATIYAKVLNDLFFGATVGSGNQIIMSVNETHTIPGSSPYTITVTPPNSGVFLAANPGTNATGGDQGVILNTTGVSMTLVASGVAAGEYEVNDSTGVYTFAAANAGQGVQISYMYTVSASGTNSNVTNKPMGSMPTFGAWFFNNQFGMNVALYFPFCISSKLNLSMKNEDFTVPEFDFSAFSDTAGNLFYEYLDQ